MSDLLQTLIAIVGGIIGFAGLMLALYGLASLLPKKLREGGRAAAFALPPLALLVIGLLIPAVLTVIGSFYGDGIGGYGARAFNGLANYREIAGSEDARNTLINSILWMFFSTLFAGLIGLTVARYSDGMRGERVVKAMIFLPVAISLAGAGITWSFIYQGDAGLGLLNTVTKALHLPASMGGNGDQLWLVSPQFGGINLHFNTMLLIVIFIWVQTGFNTMMFSAAIKGVPESLIEAAKVDGATTKQAFYKITIPYIKPTIVTVITLNTLAALKSFDIVQATTAGNYDTWTIANVFYRKYWVEGRPGFGQAMAVLLFAIVIPIMIVSRIMQARAEAASY